MRDDKKIAIFLFMVLAVVTFSILNFLPNIIEFWWDVRNIEPVACGSSCQYDVRNYLYAQECLNEGITDIELCFEYIEETHNETNE